MLKINIATLSLLLITMVSLNAQERSEVPIPTQSQIQWQNAELAALFCYDLHVFDGQQYNQGENQITPIPDYNIFNPKKLDTDQWVKAAKDAGVKIAIFTASHETGFSLFQSKVNPYCMKALEWRDGKGDIVKEFVASCRKYGVLPGIFFGIRTNSYMGVNFHKMEGEGRFVENRRKHYNRMIKGMFTELVSNYGDLAVLWFDVGVHSPEFGGPDLLPIFDKYQTNCVFYSSEQRSEMRFSGAESGRVPYPCAGTFKYPSLLIRPVPSDMQHSLKHGNVDGKYYMPAFSNTTLRGDGAHDWFWAPGRDAHVLSLASLMSMYYASVGHNTTFIVGLTPDTDGLLPEHDVKRLKEWGDEIKRRFSNPIAATSGTGKKITLTLPETQKINQVVLMEDISKGERIRKFVLEGETKKGWKTIFEGSVIGHKFIHQFDEIEASSFRLNIVESKGEPQVLDFSIYHVENK